MSAVAGLFEAPPVANDPLSLSLESFTAQAALGLSVFTAAQEALRGFRSETHKGALRTFIVTGNPLPWIPAESSAMSGLNIQKTIAWRLTELFANAYSKEQVRYVYFALKSSVKHA